MKTKFIVFTAAFMLAGSVSAFAAHNNKAYSNKGTQHKTATTKKHSKKAKAMPSKNGATADDQSSISYRTHIFEQQLHTLEAQIEKLKKEQAGLRASQAKKTAFGGVFAHGPVITTSPYFGGEPNYSGFDLLINLPDVNEDASYLKVRQQVENFYKEHNIDASKRPVITLTGELAAQATQRSEFTDHTDNDLDLTAADLDVFAEISKWISGVLALKYDNESTYSVGRVNNSRVMVDRGYITVGNLNTSPVYFSVGQMIVPFGLYSYNYITDPMTLDIAKTKARAALLGFTTNNGFYGSTYYFQGDTYTPNYRRNWGVNLGYAHHNPEGNFVVDVGGGYIYNIADSEGMQATSGNLSKDFGVFGGFGVDNGNKANGEDLYGNVQGLDLHGSVIYKALHLNAEYIASLDSFDSRDLSFNNSGAQPDALDLQATVNFKLWRWHKPSYFAVGYDYSWEALGLNLPEQSYIAVLGTSIWKSTVESIEYRHDINYDSNDVAVGNGNRVVRGGSVRNLWTANFRVFF